MVGWNKRKKGTFAGAAMIVFGLIGAVVSYVSDNNSLDYLRMGNAWTFAVLHAVLWTVGGAFVILWFNCPRHNALPMEVRDDNRDGMR